MDSRRQYYAQTDLWRWRRAVHGVGICLVLLLLGCGSEPTEAEPRPNILVISIDTLRADHLGCYGYDRPTSPVLDRLAAEGVLFETVVANSPWTLPSHASMLTGLFPRNHGLKTHDTGLREEIPTLASVLAGHGYQTMALVNSHNLSERYGLHRGFEKFQYFPILAGGNRVRCGGRQVRQAIEWIEEADEPFFLFLHNYDVHSGYDPAPEFLSMFERAYDGSFQATTDELMNVRRGTRQLTQADLQHTIDRYDAGIRQLDAKLSTLFDHLDRSGLSDDTLVIVTSDHGEEFLEHGGVLHGRTMYNEVLRVPLVLRGLWLPTDVRVPGLVQLTDIFPTILELAAVPAPEVEGVSLVPTWNRGSFSAEGRPAYAEADHWNTAPDIKRMVQVGSLKLIYDRLAEEHELYDLQRDPRELVNLIATSSSAARTLTNHIERYMADESEAVELPALSEIELEELVALGYVH